MRMSPAIVEVDLHGCTKEQAKVTLDAELKRASSAVYRIRVIHGYNLGTQLRTFVRKHYKSHPKVIRIEIGVNQGETDLVLKEM